MKILFIFTGGTIASQKLGNTISLNDNNKSLLLELYNKKYGIDFDYDIISPLNVLSENVSGSQISTLTKYVKQNISKYNGIIVTHGTDSLQYSACATAYSLGNNTTPVVFVSANYPLQDNRSNALINLKGAIELIKLDKHKGVFVSYKNPRQKLKIFRATHLIFSHHYTDKVYTLKDRCFGYFNNNFNFIKSPLYCDFQDKLKPLPLDNIKDFSSEILWLNQYVGMPYPKLNNSIKCIIINAYHSGTINTQNIYAKEFFSQARKLNIPCLLVGATNQNYSSKNEFLNLNITSIYNISPIAVYLKVWGLLTSGLDILSNINLPLACDIVK